LQETSPKDKQISIKTSPKTSNPQALKKTATPQKNKPKFAGKLQGWQHWLSGKSRTVLEKAIAFVTAAAGQFSVLTRKRNKGPQYYYERMALLTWVKVRHVNP